MNAWISNARPTAMATVSTSSISDFKPEDEDLVLALRGLSDLRSISG